MRVRAAFRRSALVLLSLVGVPFASGCAGSADGGTGAKPLVLRADPFMVPAYSEVTKCQVIHAKNDAIEFQHISSSMVEGSHHLILYRDASDVLGGTPPPEGLGDCEMESPRLFIYGAQSAEHEVTLPEGIGGDLEEDTIFILEIHFANASGQDIEAFAEVTIDPAPEGAIEQYSGVLFYLNTDFEIPPGAGIDGAPAYAESAVCEVPESVNVFRLQSHTHKRGLRVDGWLADEQGAEIQKIYKNDDWHAPAQRSFEPALPVTGGQTIKFECSWSNETADVIEFGPSVEDEMCILGAGYYPRLDGPLGLRGNVFCIDGDIYY